MVRVSMLFGRHNEVEYNIHGACRLPNRSLRNTSYSVGSEMLSLQLARPIPDRLMDVDDFSTLPLPIAFFTFLFVRLEPRPGLGE